MRIRTDPSLSHTYVVLISSEWLLVLPKDNGPVDLMVKLRELLRALSCSRSIYGFIVLAEEQFSGYPTETIPSYC